MGDTNNTNGSCSRRQYRSVAFGTWKVGNARNFTDRRSEEPNASARLKCSSPELHLTSTLIAQEDLNLLSVDKRNSRLGESSPNLSRIHHTHTQLSLGLPNKMSNSTTTHDFFSSTEYCKYVCSQEAIDTFNGNSKSSEPIQAAFRKSRRDERFQLEDVSNSSNNCGSKSARNLKYSQSSRRKYETSVADDISATDRSHHHRSHSAGPHSTYSTSSPTTASTSEMNRSGVSRNESNTNFLRATKRFFKKIYTSATLPKKQTSASVDNFQKENGYFDERIGEKKMIVAEENDYTTMNRGDRHDLDDDYDDETMRSENATMDISYPDSGFEMDRASTPEQSSVSMTSTSKSDEPVNFANLFEHLKREMAEMRERDAQILADLQRVECQIQTVKQAQILASLQDEFEPVESMQL